MTGASHEQEWQVLGDVPWLGGGAAPRLGGGRVAVLLLWSATSVHCERALAVTAWLEVRFAGRPLVVASVHVPRCEAERGIEFVERAAARHCVRHPVAVDDAGRSLSAFGVASLPGLVVVDAQGEVRFRGTGEPDRERLTLAVEALLDDAYGSVPEWNGTPVAPPRGMAATWFPTAVAVDVARDLLWVADTGRHRVLAVELATGVLRHVAGVGRPGAADGDVACAAFASPRGLAAAEGRCYVADAGNHCVRRIDLEAGSVATVLGDGRFVTDLAGGRAGAAQGIAAPWDVELVGTELFVAMAGVHQVWRMDLGDGHAQAWAGTGRVGDADGVRHDAGFAQPAAVAFGPGELAVVDADGGAVRLAGLATQHVRTVVGPGALVQPRGIAWHRGDLLVSDTLRNRVVRVAVRDGSVEEIVGEAAGLCGPEGLAVSRDVLFVADVHNHRIVRVDLATGAAAPFELVDSHPDHPEPPLPPIVLRAQARVALCFPMPAPNDERLHPDAQGHAHLRSASGDVLTAPCTMAIEPQGSWGTIRDVPTGPPGEGELDVVVRFATCDELEQEPHVQELIGRFAIHLAPEAPDAADLPFP